MHRAQPLKESDEGCVQGEEVINCYGRLSPGELLRRFGISEAGRSPHACCEVGAQRRTLLMLCAPAVHALPASLLPHAKVLLWSLQAKQASRHTRDFAWVPQT